MNLIIKLKKPINDVAAARIIFDLVCTRLAGYPDIEITGYISNPIILKPEPEG